MQATLTMPGAEPIVLNLSEVAYHDVLALPPPERARVIALGITAMLAVAAPEPETEPTEADLAAIGRGISDADAGRTVPGGIAFARLHEKYGFPKGDNPF